MCRLPPVMASAVPTSSTAAMIANTEPRKSSSQMLPVPISQAIVPPMREPTTPEAEGGQDAEVLPTWLDEPGDRADDESEDEESDHDGDLL